MARTAVSGSPSMASRHRRGLVQVGQVVGDAPPRRIGELCRRDAQRQRQPGTGGGQLRGGRRFGRDPRRPDAGGEQLARLGRRQYVQGQPLRAVPRGQAGEAVPAGHHGQAAGRPGQQRPDLVGGVRVVEQDQYSPAGQAGAVEGGRLAGIGRNQLPRYAQRTQEPS